MKVLILNSGMGSRMGQQTKSMPKCMTILKGNETILSRQLRLLGSVGVMEVIITTGAFADKLAEYCNLLKLPIKYKFVHNAEFAETNYIYSIYCAREWLTDDDIVLMHGDMVFEPQIIEEMIKYPYSCMAVSADSELLEKDFKAILCGENIVKIGVEYFENAVAAQPLYKLKQKDWIVWLDQICRFCESGNVKCYAEKALNEVSDHMDLKAYDIGSRLCNEIDNEEDLEVVSRKVKELEDDTVLY